LYISIKGEKGKKKGGGETESIDARRGRGYYPNLHRPQRKKKRKEAPKKPSSRYPRTERGGGGKKKRKRKRTSTIEGGERKEKGQWQSYEYHQFYDSIEMSRGKGEGKVM